MDGRQGQLGRSNLEISGAFFDLVYLSAPPFYR